MKQCCACGEVKSLADFHKTLRNPDGLAYKCKGCLRAYNRAQYAKNPERARGYQRQWAGKNPARTRAIKRKHNWAKQGIDPQAAKAALEKFSGCCELCERNYPGKSGWHVDHDHATGRVRGVLCHWCNTGLGRFRDSVDLLRKAAQYVARRTF